MSRKQERIDAARIQRAITGLQIPMLQIPALYKYAEKLIASGADDDKLRDCVLIYLGVAADLAREG